MNIFVNFGSNWRNGFRKNQNVILLWITTTTMTDTSHVIFRFYGQSLQFPILNYYERMDIIIVFLLI